MLRMGAAVLAAFVGLAAAAAQTTTEAPPARQADETARLREEVERLNRALEKQHSHSERQIDDLRRSMESRLADVANGLDAVRISVDAVKNAVVGLRLPKRPSITITADPAAPIVCGDMGCEATALDHCRKSGYELAYVVHKLEKPTQWLFSFVCRDS